MQIGCKDTHNFPLHLIILVIIYKKKNTMSAPALIVVNIEKISQYGYFFDMSTTFS